MTVRSPRPRLLRIAGGIACSGTLAAVALVGLLIAGSHGGGGPAGASPSPSPDAVAGDYVASVDAGDWAHVGALLAPGFVFHDDHDGYAQGRAGFLVWGQVVRESYPDRSLEVVSIRVAGDVATVQIRTADRAGRCPAPGSPSDVVRMRVRGGLIAELWSTHRQLGLGC
jgi:hypothetical protein